MSPEIGIIIGLALAVAAVFIVTRPLRQAASTSVDDQTRLADLLTQRDAAYQVLRDLDSDFHIGKLSEDDYRPMRVQALAQAAEIVAQLDAYQTSKSQLPTPALSAAEGASFQLAKAKIKSQERAKTICPNCGTPHAPDDAFCRKCGRVLQIAEQNLNREDAKT